MTLRTAFQLLLEVSLWTGPSLPDLYMRGKVGKRKKVTQTIWEGTVRGASNSKLMVWKCHTPSLPSEGPMSAQNTDQSPWQLTQGHTTNPPGLAFKTRTRHTALGTGSVPGG